MTAVQWSAVRLPLGQFPSVLETRRGGRGRRVEEDGTGCLWRQPRGTPQSPPLSCWFCTSVFKLFWAKRSNPKCSVASGWLARSCPHWVYFCPLPSSPLSRPPHLPPLPPHHTQVLPRSVFSLLHLRTKNESKVGGTAVISPFSFLPAS